MTSVIEEPCPYCGEATTGSTGDAGGRLCNGSRRHQWARCVKCITYFDPRKTWRTLSILKVSKFVWWSRFRSQCPACAIVALDEIAPIELAAQRNDVQLPCIKVNEKIPLDELSLRKIE